MPEVKKSFQVEGLKDLEAALQELPKATGKNAIRRALTAAAQPIVQTATVLIKVRRIRPAIVVSRIKFASGAAGKMAFAEAMKAGATRAEAGEIAHAANIEAGGEGTEVTSGVATIGPTRRAFYGFEFGTKHIAPKPFMRPAWDAHKAQALTIMRSELKDQIEKARIRIVKKQLRLLASLNK